MHLPTIGWIGLGLMGNPMAQNLLKAGYPLTVYNRTAAKMRPLQEAGARTASSPAELWQTAEIIFTMVSDDAATEQIYTGEDGLLTKPRPGGITVDMSTVAPATSIRISALCEAAGMSHMDAPVSGSVGPAEQAALLIMAGGPVVTYNQVLPIFQCLAKRSMHLGGAGMGNRAKLAINLLLGFHLQGLAETLLFARQQGLQAADMMTLINEGGMGNGISRSKTDSILAGNYPPVFPLKHLAKDLRLAAAEGAATPMALLLQECYQQALQQGWGEADAMAILGYLDRLHEP